MAGRWLALPAFRSLAWPLAAVLLLPGAGGCGRGGGSTEPEAKVRLTKLLRLYQLYADKNRKGPPDEQALRAFGQKLSVQERDEYLIGDDLDGIFTSPRDNQKYVIRFNLKLDPGGPRGVPGTSRTSRRWGSACGRRGSCASRGRVA